jgi:hypothetical protein
MHTVEDIETIHVYMVREEEKQPYTVFPLVCAFLCLLGIVAVTFYSSEHPYYEHETLTVPARVLPLQTFTATQPIIPTGIKTYPATTAQGMLTITNGSVIAQILPAGFTSISNTGISVITDRAVFVPAGNANGYGEATVSAHAVASGQSGNIVTLSIDRVEGTSLYIRNLNAFTGGKDSYSVKYATAQDKQAALLQARGILLSKSSGLHFPCAEAHSAAAHNLIITWRCQFIRYHIPSFYHVTGVRIIGKNLLLDVWFIPRPARIWVK